jgi:hypothetical protein
MLTTRNSHRRKGFSFVTAIFLLFIVASISFGSIILSASSAQNKQSEKSLGDAPENQKFRNFLQNTPFVFLTNFSNLVTEPDATFLVNDDGDTEDALPGDGICADISDKCTLRAAIQEANVNPGTDQITFDLPNQSTIIQLSLTPGELVITQPLTITGPGARLLTISGNADTALGIFKINSTVTTAVNISAITVANSTGRGINNDGKLNLSDVTIKANGVGIYNTKELNITRSLIANNTSGGIYLTATSIVNISNTTVTNNASSDFGGGIYSSSTDVTLNNVTISNNTAATSGGGIYYNNALQGINVRNTIIAGNTATNGPDIFTTNVITGTFKSRGNNLIGKSDTNIGFVNGANSDQVGTSATPANPLLGPLQNNGGPTDTRALQTASVAKNAGNSCVVDATCTANNPISALTTDQRGTGFTRNFETGVDIGAFETFYPVPAINSFVPTSRGTGTAAFELIINGSNFVADSIVKWNGQNRVTTFVSNTQLKAQILAADVATAGQNPVTVINPLPGGGPSQAVNFAVADCSFSINPTTSTPFTAAGGTGTVAVQTISGCGWTATVSPAATSWITISNGSSGSGNGTVAYTVAANNGPSRTGTITIAGQTFTVTQNDGCTFSITPTSMNFSAAGGNGSVAVTASNQGCMYVSNVPPSTPEWFTINSNSTGTGNKTLTYTVAANNGPMRNKDITIAGKTFSVSQDSGCTFTISPASASIPVIGGTGSVTVTASNQACTWNTVVPASTPEWITITSGASGTGNGTVNYTVAANNGPARNKDITIAGQVHNVSQGSGCDFTFTPTSMNFAATGGTSTVAVAASHQGCTWNATFPASTPEWLTITSGASGTGNGTIAYTVSANDGPARNKNITVGGKTFNVSQDNGCVYTINPTSSTPFAPAGGNGTFAVTAGNGCAWTATVGANTPWITITNGSGSGNGTIAYTVAANTGPQRTGTITVAGKTYTVTQNEGCVYSINPTSSTPFSPAGGSGTVAVTSDAGCGWSATVSASAPWITITSGASGSGNGTVAYTVAPNNGLARSGTITIAGKTFTVNQDNGCVYTLTPTSSTPFAAAGGNGTFAVGVSNAQCPWTATVSANAPWITITSGGSGPGSGTVAYTVAANNGPSRTGTITVGDKTFTVNQDSGCTFTISPLSMNFPATGGTSTVAVTASNQACTWNTNVPASTPEWITITSGASGTGNGTVAYTVAANNGPQRNKDITIAGKTFNVSQTTGCDFTISPLNMNFTGAGGNGTVAVTASNQGCTWLATVAANAPWITITSGASGTGNGTVAYTVAANNGPQRNGTITIGNKTFNVTQDSGCTFTISPASASIPVIGGTGSVTVTASNQACTWNTNVPSSTPEWITITSGASGTGNGTVTYTVTANNGPQRNKDITIAGKTHNVSQANGCVYTINPTSSTPFPSSGGNGTVQLTVSNQLCQWDVSVAPNTPWITITSPASGTGAATIAYSVGVNTGAQRNGIITIKDKTFTVIQLSPFVTTLSDSGPGSLREAIINANNSPGDDVIRFQPSLNGTITLTSGELTVTNNGKLEIIGPGADKLTISGNNLSRIFYLDNAVFSLSGITLTGGNGGGVNSTDNFKYGGAIYVNSGTLNLNGVNVSSNALSVPNLGNGRSDSNGGAIYINLGTNHRIQNSTIASNSAFIGGGIFSQSLSLSIENTTLYGNTSVKNGAALFMSGGVALSGVTITKNQAELQGAGIYITFGTLDIGNTIISGNTGPEITFGAGTITFTGNNMIGDQPGDSTNTLNPISYPPSTIRDTPPLLGALSMYGGSTPTVAVLPGSPAINAGDNTTNTFSTDQRGLNRIITNTVDIGAFEYNIGIVPNNTSLADGTLGQPYLQSFVATRVNGTNPNETFSYLIVEGILPSGVGLQQNGLVSGTPTSGGLYSFTVKATGSDGMAGANRYTINVGCNYSINPQNNTINASGATGIVTVTAPPGCSWTAVSNSNWITVPTNTNGTGTGSFQYTVAANNGLVRTGTITIADKTFTVTQLQGCSFTLNPTSKNVVAAGETGSFQVVASNSQCPWSTNITTSDNWISVTSGTSGTGNGTINYSVAPNTGVQRFGSVAVDNQLFTITQANGCPFTFSSTGGSLPVGGGTLSFNVTTNAGCTWTPSASSPWITFTAGGGINTGSGTVTISAAANSGAARSGTVSVGVQNYTVSQAGTTARRSAFDFDGDSKADISVFRPSNGLWYLLNSQTGFGYLQFGAAGDKLVPADYDGDGKTDIAVFRGDSWFIQRTTSGFTNIQYGAAGDLPVPADFDGDGKTDIAVYRPSSGNWFLLRSSLGQLGAQFGISGDVPMPGDFDGDGKADLALFRPSNGVWYMQQSTAGFTGVQFGAVGDKLVPADYDGDGKTDLAVFRPSNGTWYINRSQLGSTVVQFGLSTDVPAPADYDGDGKTDIAVYRNDTWFLQRSTDGFIGVQFGGTGDLPVSNSLVR